MASEMEDSVENPTESQPPQSLPQYSEMIMAAIEALNEENGSSKSAISKHIEDAYGNLPEAHATLLSNHLNRMRQSGELAMVKDSYMKPGPNAPPRRGRGRPPKPKSDAPVDAVVSPPRPRGRPPKPRDPFSPPKEKQVPVPGRSRGRPPKKQKTESSEKQPAPAGAATRGRGRPPKVTSVMDPVVC